MSFFAQSYGELPITLQHGVVSAKGLEFRLHRTRDSLIERTRLELLRSDCISTRERDEVLASRLRSLINVAVKMVPHYRAGLRNGVLPHPDDFDDIFELLSQFPFTEKSHLRGREDQFLCEGISTRSLRVGYTSGSTGSPTKIFETQDSLSKRFGFVGRLRSWAGVQAPLRPRRAQFTGRSVAQGGDVPWRWNLFDHALLLSSVHLNPSSVRNYVRALRKCQPTLIDGYPTAMFTLAKLAEAEGLTLPRIPTAIASAETLTEEMRRTISRAFSARVFNQYAASEPSCFWSDCEAGSLHIHSEYGVSEIIRPDGSPSGVGEIGEVVVTSVLNNVMPLIRYRTGDLAVRGLDEACSCGRTLPRVQRVIGRQDEIVFTKERGFVGRLDPVFKGLEGIVESQIRHESLTVFRVLLVPDRAKWTAEQRRKLEINLQEKLGSSQRILIEEVPSIERGPNGKFRSVVSLCRSDYPIMLEPYTDLDP
jgi:phenylacetate-CoA ligase